MPEREWILFLKDIQNCSRKIITFTDNMSLKEFLKDAKTYDAVMRNLQIIGEAVKLLPYDFRRKHNNIEWKKVAGLRDIVVHEYFGINEQIIWDVIKNKIPDLKKEINIILKSII